MKKKMVSLCVALSLAVTALIGGTFAYFTDETESKENAFTVGNVTIDLEEPSWNAEDGHELVPGVAFEKDPTVTVDENSSDCYMFLKMDLNKYVSLINLAGVDAYKNNIADLNGDYPGFRKFCDTLFNDSNVRETVVNRWFNGIEHEKWEIMNKEQIMQAIANTQDQSNPVKLDVILGYKGESGQNPVLKGGNSVKFMDSFQMPSTVTQSMMDGEDAYYVSGASKSDFNTDQAEFKMTFTAYAIQAGGIDSLQAAYETMFQNN